MTDIAHAAQQMVRRPGDGQCSRLSRRCGRKYGATEEMASGERKCWEALRTLPDHEENSASVEEVSRREEVSAQLKKVTARRDAERDGAGFAEACSAFKLPGISKAG
jgi:hypothetical protein